VCDYTLSNEYLDNIANVLKWTPDACNWLLIGCNKTIGHIHNLAQNEQLPSSVSLELLVNVGRKQLNASSDVSCKLELFSFFYGCKCVFQGLVQLWHRKHFHGQTNLCLIENNVLIAHKLSFVKALESYAYFLTFICIFNCNINASVISYLVSEQLSFLYIFGCHLDTWFVNRVCTRWLNRKSQLKELFIHSTNPLCSITPDVLNLLSNYHNTTTVLATKHTLACQRPTSEQIVLALQLEPMTAIWRLGNCHVNAETYYHIADLLANNLNSLQTIGTVQILKQMKNTVALRKLIITNNDISDEAAEYIAMVFSCNPVLEEVDLSNNNLQETGAVELLKTIKYLSKMKKFNISHNNITDSSTDKLTTLLSNWKSNAQKINSVNRNLHTRGLMETFCAVKSPSKLGTVIVSHNSFKDCAGGIAVILSCGLMLDMSYNSLQPVKIIKILREKELNLTEICFSHIYITNEAADHLAVVLSHSNKLEKLILTHNDLQTARTTKIFQGNRNLSNLKHVNISNNKVDYQAASIIANALSPSTTRFEL